MASAKQAAEKAPEQAPNEAPSGFRKGGTPDVDGWYEPQKGVAFQGQIVGRLEVPNKRGGGTRDVVLVELQYPLAAKLQGGETVKLAAGQVLAVGIRHQLREMLLYVENRGRVWVKAIDKKKLPDGNDMWRFEQAYEGKKAPITRMPVSADAVRDDSVPDF